jgi:hypothetical protein
MRPTGTALQRDRTLIYYRYYCLRGHAHRTETTATKCDTAFGRRLRNDREKGEQTCSN